jgi:hypothetical protein
MARTCRSIIGLILLILLRATPSLRAAEPSTGQIHCDGILGNSGEQGASLVRFSLGAKSTMATGAGVAYDRFGTLWGLGGDGILNRYAVDGRLLAKFKVPASPAGAADALTLVGDQIVLLLNGQLFTLPVAATADEPARPLKVAAAHISFSSALNSIIAADLTDVFRVDVRDGRKRPLAKMDHVQAVELGPDQSVWVTQGGKVHKFVGGTEVTSSGWPRESQGGYPQFLAGNWYTSTGHGTLRRFNAAMEADPGVVLGGGSGSFIGHLDEDPEVDYPRGLAFLHDGVFAVGGSGGIIHLLVWQPRNDQFDIARRIGPLPLCRGLGLDRQGNIWCFAGVWHWDDLPDSPLSHGVPRQDGPAGQVVMLDNDTMVAPFRMPSRLAFWHGTLEREVTRELIDTGKPLDREPVGSAVYRDGAQLRLLVTDGTSNARSFRISAEGKFESDTGVVTLTPAKPVRCWSTLGMAGPESLIAAADGNVIRLALSGHDWAETGRWNSWGDGPAERFGDQICLTTDSGRLWVSDTQRHRVLVFELDKEGGKPIAGFGGVDRPGDDLASLSQPTTIAARGSRAVVYDAGNQRLMKLSLGVGSD